MIFMMYWNVNLNKLFSRYCIFIAYNTNTTYNNKKYSENRYDPQCVVLVAFVGAVECRAIWILIGNQITSDISTGTWRVLMASFSSPSQFTSSIFECCVAHVITNIAIVYLETGSDQHINAETDCKQDTNNDKHAAKWFCQTFRGRFDVSCSRNWNLQRQRWKY